MGEAPARNGRLAELDRRCLAGLAEAAAALAGEDPAPVCRAFAEWRRAERRRSWPWLPGLCWAALEPLGAAFPAEDDDAVTLGRFLVGAERDPDRVRRASEALRQRVLAAGASRVASGPDVTVELRRRTLEAAVDRFWAELRGTFQHLRGPVLAGDRARADALVLASRRQLEDTASRVDSHARRLAEVLEAPARVPASRGPAPPAAEHRDSSPDHHPAEATGRLDPVTPTAGVAVNWVSAPPQQRRAATSAEPAEPDPETVEYRRVREHPLAPVLFLVAVTLVALVWLLVIAGSGSG